MEKLRFPDVEHVIERIRIFDDSRATCMDPVREGETQRSHTIRETFIVNSKYTEIQ